MSDTDRTVECAEYVLGTSTAEERAALERDMETSPDLRAEVRGWEDWLAGLNDAIPEVAPSAAVWSAIEARIRPPAAAPASVPLPIDGRLASLRRSRTRWRAATAALGAIAAGLALFVVEGRIRPPVTYLAVVDRGGDLPALIVHVDTRADTVTVRSVAAETPPDRVLQLWYVGAGAPPRPLGVLDGPDTQVKLPPNLAGSSIAGATLAVSVEPPGGSPTGAPTGQVVYSGKLIRDQ